MCHEGEKNRAIVLSIDSVKRIIDVSIKPEWVLAGIHILNIVTSIIIYYYFLK